MKYSLLALPLLYWQHVHIVLKKGLYFHTKNDDGNGMGRMKCFSYLGGEICWTLPSFFSASIFSFLANILLHFLLK